MTYERCQSFHPHVIHMIVDSREKCPLLFPATFELPVCPDRITNIPVLINRRPLNAGDYTIEIDGVSYADTVCAERKGSVQELARNLLSEDSTRHARSLSRLSSTCRHPCFLVEVPFHDLFATRHTLHPPILIHRMLVTARLHHIDLLWVPKPSSLQSRRLLGTFLIHYFWSIISHSSLPIPDGLLTPLDIQYPHNTIEDSKNF